MTLREHSRRHVLRTGGRLATAAAVVNTAGCLGSLPFLGGWKYQKWLHAPGEIEEGLDHYGFQLERPKAILGKESHLPGEYVDQYRNGGIVAAFTSIDPEKVTHVLTWFGFAVVKGGYDESDLTDELEAIGFESNSDHEGYTLYVNRDQGSDFHGTGLGVEGGKFVLAGSDDPDATVDQLETVIDTRKGDGSRYVERDDAMKRLVDELGVHHEVTGRILREDHRRWAGLLGRGSTVHIKGKNTRLRRVWVFEDHGAAKDASVDDWVDEREDAEGVWSQADSIETSVDGKAVVAKGAVPSDELGRRR